MAIYILYSADYEVFLGGNYCNEKEVLIDPTNNLLDLFDDLKIPITFFADVFSILRYKEQNLFFFPELAENQLKDAIRRGQDVQSHVHPHWNYTNISENKYSVNTDYFLLGNLDSNKAELFKKIRSYLTKSKDYLNNLLRPVDKDYNCIAYRAGGYGLQPYPELIIKALMDSGFVIDSSIVPDLIFKSNVNLIDFSIVPKTANYYLDNELQHPSKTDNGIFEIPIASCHFNVLENSSFQIKFLLRYLLNIKIPRISDPAYGNYKGYTIQVNGNTHKKSKYQNYLKSFGERFYYLDCSPDSEKMFHCTNKYLNKFDYVNNDVFFSFNMHPKEMTKNHFAALEKYQNKMKMQYADTLHEITYQEAAKLLTDKKK
jgi:hypothetical protein